MADMHKVFVYGTLKRGIYNHRLLPTEGSGGPDSAVARWLCDALTIETWPMVVASRYSIPFMLDAPNRVAAALQVKGEVYEVNDLCLSQLDRLERHPDWYVRTPVKVRRIVKEQLRTGSAAGAVIQSDPEVEVIQAYVLPPGRFHPSLLEREHYLSEYQDVNSDNAVRVYVPPAARPTNSKDELMEVTTSGLHCPGPQPPADGRKDKRIALVCIGMQVGPAASASAKGADVAQMQANTASLLSRLRTTAADIVHVYSRAGPKEEQITLPLCSPLTDEVVLHLDAALSSAGVDVSIALTTLTERFVGKESVLFCGTHGEMLAQMAAAIAPANGIIVADCSAGLADGAINGVRVLQSGGLVLQ